MTAGKTKFRSHMSVVTDKIMSGGQPQKEKIKTATEPLTTKSNMASMGIMEEIRYTLAIKERAFK